VRFAFTDDQLLFRDAVRELLSKEHPPEVLRAIWEHDGTHSTELWSSLAEMGVIGSRVPEEYGGLGMTELDLVLLHEELGRAAVAEPVVDTTAVAAPLLCECPPDVAAPWLQRIATGDAVVTVRNHDELVLDADVADAVVAWSRDRVVLVASDSLSHAIQPSVDQARRLFAVEWSASDEVVLSEGDATTQMIERALNRGALATAAQLVGLAEQLLAVTVEYVKQREQFGVAIGTFQAVKHHLADALLRLEFAKPAVYRAAYSMTHERGEATRDVSMAKAVASDAASGVARAALQCHGAIAYTVEYDLHMWMKRVWSLERSWGDSASHRRRVAESVLGPSPAN
jgi:alkylation response protein AidB-like acyl-CoA dehydrogenase